MTLTAPEAEEVEPRVDDGRRGRLAGSILLIAAVAVAAGLAATVHPAAPVAVVVVVVVVVAIWRRPLVASVLVASVVPAMAGMARDLPVPGFKASELLLVVCLAPLVLRRSVRWRRLNAVDVALTVVAVVGLALEIANGLNADNLAIDSVLRSGLFPAFTLATWWVASRGVGDRRDVDTVLRWVLLVSVVPALLGILQYLDVLGVRALLISLVDGGLMPDPGSGNSRVTGPFPIAHSFGGYLLVPLMIAAVLLLRGRATVLPRRVLAVVVAVDTAALVLSVTVTTLSWAVVAFLVAAAVTRQLRRGAAALAVVVVLVAGLFWAPLADRYEQQTTAQSGTEEGAVPQTFQYRVLVWQRDYLPLLGEAAPAGLHIKPGDVVFDSTENQYITLILRGGVGLLAVTIVSLVALGRRAGRAAGAEDGSVRYASGALVGLLVFLPFACFAWPYVTNAGLPQSLFGVAGAVLALAGSPATRRPGTGPA